MEHGRFPMEVIQDFCSSIEEFVTGEGSERFGHHLAHVSPEPWLTVEAAYLVNHKSVLPGWRALVEQHKIDITLVHETDKKELVLEFKLLHPEWWDWAGVYKDLWGEPGSTKPLAHASICFLFWLPLNSWRRLLQRPGMTLQRRPSTEDKYNRELDVLGSLAVGTTYPIRSLTGETRLGKVVYRGPRILTRWAHLPAVPWFLLAFERGENRP